MISKDEHPSRPWICDLRGHNVRYHRRFATREEAKRFEALILTTRGQTREARSGAQTFEAFVLAHIAELEGSNQDDAIRPGTLRGWKSKLRRMPSWLRCKQVHRITEGDCLRFLNWLHTTTQGR